MFVGFDNADDIHDSDGELDVPSGFVVDSKSCFFVHDDDFGLAGGEGESESVPGMEGGDT